MLQLIIYTTPPNILCPFVRRPSLRITDHLATHIRVSIFLLTTDNFPLRFMFWSTKCVR